ncbi:hypothetical protein OG625_09165 [Streptomyces sp. NBC_01351]|uniref:hypothetical protein n=1 Tax=Streptomyces sp. NBC_01351 TaxID=2903833 RepID=UPI002E3785F1|nr:hypothetical protein [Streptomyces sp. NBC_01351]
MTADPESESAYWNPLPTARELTAGWPDQENGLDIGTGEWKHLNPLTVPGPFYTGETDNGGNGPVYAPGLVLGDDDLYMEFIYRQPQNPDEVRTLIDVAGGEPYGGYACDGDDRWTPDSVREWWAGRERIRAWIDREIEVRAKSERSYERADVPSLRAFAAHVDGPLERYLRGYLHWLTERVEPAPGATLPRL